MVILCRAVTGCWRRWFNELGYGEAMRGEEIDVPAERPVIVPVSAERLDPTLLGLEVARYPTVALSGGGVFYRGVVEERGMSERDHQPAGGSQTFGNVAEQRIEVRRVHQDHKRDDPIEAPGDDVSWETLGEVGRNVLGRRVLASGDGQELGASVHTDCVGTSFSQGV